MIQKSAKKILHYPRLDTVIRVEEIIIKTKEPLSKNEIDRRLKTKIMRPTLNVILNYLEDHHKIAILKEGIIWIWYEDASPKLKKAIKNGVEVRGFSERTGHIIFKKH